MEWYIEKLAFVAVIVNLICFRYAYKTFNVQLCANYIMCIDAGITGIACSLMFVATVIDDQSATACSTFSFVIILVPSLFALYNLIFVYTRYQRIVTATQGKVWKSDKQLIRIVNYVLVLGTIVVFSIVFCNAYLNWNFLMFYNDCMGFKHAPNYLFLLGFGGFRVIILIVTMKIDISCLLLVRRLARQVVPGSNQIQMEKNHILNEVPMRSTLLSALFLSLWSMVPLLILSDYSHQQKLFIGLTVGLFSNIIKSPTIVFLTFRVNTENRRVDLDAEREQNRQLEIQDALSRRHSSRVASGTVRANEHPEGTFFKTHLN